ncbi:5282_t:CDS:2, partial [Racocetra persica]
PVRKAQLFNSIVKDCRYIEKIKPSVWYEDEGIVLADLIPSFLVQALVDQKRLNSATFEDIHRNCDLCDKKNFNYTICELNSDAINALAHLEYSYGAYNINDGTNPIELLSDLIK